MDKMDGINYPNFLSEEIDLLLNQAQDRFVKQRYGKNNLKKTSFEEEQKRVEDLKALVRQAIAVPYASSSSNIANNSQSIVLTTDEMFVIQEKAHITCDSCNGTIVRNTNIQGFPTVQATESGIEVEVRPITHLEYDKIKNDPFKGPDYTKVLRLMFNSVEGISSTYLNRIELIPAEGCSIIRYIYRYIKRPDRISLVGNTTCELAEYTHQEIVDEAVKIALEGIEAKRNTTFTPIIDNNKE